MSPVRDQFEHLTLLHIKSISRGQKIFKKSFSHHDYGRY